MPPADPQTRIILVVDDEPAVRRLACQMLERGGYRTVEAETGRHALAVLASDPDRILLVLSDVRMPQMNGLELEQAIREGWPALPVILMSGEVTREWVVRLAAGGAPQAPSQAVRAGGVAGEGPRVAEALAARKRTPQIG